MTQNRIRDLRRQKGLTVVALSESVGISHGYLTRIENGKRGLSVELAEQIGMALGVTAADVLGFKQSGGDQPTQMSQFAEDCEPYKAGPGDLPIPRLKPNVDPWTVKSNCLDQAGLRAGDIAYVDVSAEAVESIEPLRCVVAQVYDPTPGVLQATTVMRQFVPPNLLVTNSSEKAHQRTPNLYLDTEDVAIKGVVIGSQRSFRT